MRKILFIDRDGTLVVEPQDKQVDALEKIELYQDVILSLRTLTLLGFECIMVSNQDGIGSPSFKESDFQQSQDFILRLFASQGIRFSEVFICPHTLSDNCNCRKPKTGLLDDYLQKNAIDLTQSWVIGDRESDKELAENIGVNYLPIASNHGWDLVAKIIQKSNRCSYLRRKTKETDISLTLVLDSCEESTINTPIAFFSHMLEQIATHGGFYLNLEAFGDTEVDCHHLIEDTALTLGEALKEALKDKKGIERYGFTLPMDESLATIALDICNRPFCSFAGKFSRESVGGMATEMVAHFFKTLSVSLGASIHITVTGENNHHMIEACFKVLGRALNQALRLSGNTLPSTKGVL